MPRKWTKNTRPPSLKGEEKLIEKACSKINDLMSPVSLETTLEVEKCSAKIEPGPSVRDSVDPPDPQAFECESVHDVSDWIYS